MSPDIKYTYGKSYTICPLWPRFVDFVQRPHNNTSNTRHVSVSRAQQNHSDNDEFQLSLLLWCLLSSCEWPSRFGFGRIEWGKWTIWIKVDLHRGSHSTRGTNTRIWKAGCSRSLNCSIYYLVCLLPCGPANSHCSVQGDQQFSVLSFLRRFDPLEH